MLNKGCLVNVVPMSLRNTMTNNEIYLLTIFNDAPIRFRSSHNSEREIIIDRRNRTLTLHDMTNNAPALIRFGLHPLLLSFDCASLVRIIRHIINLSVNSAYECGVEHDAVEFQEASTKAQQVIGAVCTYRVNTLNAVNFSFGNNQVYSLTFGQMLTYYQVDYLDASLPRVCHINELSDTWYADDIDWKDIIGYGCDIVYTANSDRYWHISKHGVEYVIPRDAQPKNFYKLNMDGLPIPR